MSILLHLTDTHLFTDIAHSLKGIRPHDSFMAVLAQARWRFPAPDGVILGGDMAQDECIETYRRIAELLQGWRAPFMLTPGNHANLDKLHASLLPALQEIHDYTDDLLLGQWQVIALNSSTPGSIAGQLDEEELFRLERLLSTSRAKHVMLALHHHPIPIASRWLDEIGLLNREQLWEIIERHDQVRAVLCGHIHQAFDAMHKGVRVLGTPSTCFQFKPGRDSFAMDGLSPGYRWLELNDDGSLNTGVERITGFIPDDLNNNVPY